MPTIALRLRLQCRAQRVARQSTDSPASAESGMLVPYQANSSLSPCFSLATFPVGAYALLVFLSCLSSTTVVCICHAAHGCYELSW